MSLFYSIYFKFFYLFGVVNKGFMGVRRTEGCLRMQFNYTHNICKIYDKLECKNEIEELWKSKIAIIEEFEKRTNFRKRRDWKFSIRSTSWF